MATVSAGIEGLEQATGATDIADSPAESILRNDSDDAALVVDAFNQVVDIGFEKHPNGFVIDSLADEFYRAAPGINKSGLDMFRRSPAHFHYWKRTPREATPAQEFGSFFHTLVLEPDSVLGKYVMAEKFDKRTNVGKAAFAEFQIQNVGKTIIDPDDWVRAEAMRDAVMRHKIAAVLLDTPIVERSFWWRDPETGVRCKARTDVVNEAHAAMCDLKSTGDASYSMFTRSVLDYFYHVQDRMYSDGGNAAGMDIKWFFFICCEKEPPYGVAVYRLDDEFRRIGKEIYRRDLMRYKECVEKDEWPCYAEEVRDLAMPAYGRYIKIS